MKIGIFVTEAKYPINKHNTISGHVQIALFTANILIKNGHDVTLITSKAPKEYQLPSIAENKLKVKTVTSVSKKWPSQGIQPLKIPLLFYKLQKLILSSHFDVIHFFGANGVLFFLGLHKFITNSSKSIITFHNFSISKNNLNKSLITFFSKNIDVFISLTNYTKIQMLQSGIPEQKIKVIYQGVKKPTVVNKDKTSSFFPTSKQYVLFWRNASRDNGADICTEVYKQLSNEFPDTDFIFAIRPGDEYDEELLRVSQRFENIHLFCYPYNGNITITDLLNSASVVILPFRKLSINPQLAVLETLDSGAPLITSPIESNREIIKHYENGILTLPTVNEFVTAIRQLLNEPSLARQIGNNAKQYIQEEWNWEKYETRLMELYERV